MPNPNSAQAYLQIDRRRYEALIERLVGEVKAAHTGFLGVNERALREYFAVVITKGADLSKVKLDELGKMSASELAKAADALPDKLTEDSRKAFAEAAEQRPAQVRWNRLFPEGVNDIVLPITGDAKSVDDRIAIYIEAHNARAKANFEEARTKDARNAGKVIDQREIRRDPTEPAKLQTVNPNKPPNPDGSKRWEPGQRLGAFLEARQEWALLDDFKLENSRKNAGVTTVEERDAQARELMNRKTEIRADELNPESLRVVISRDPQKVGEMSSGQRWESCMSECSSEGKPGINFHYVPKDIEAGSLVAYLVSADDPEARYPIMRQLLKPYYNQAAGETVLIPAKIYGSFAGGNSRTRQALHDTLSVFVRERINDGKSGEFMMDSRLYGDGQAGIVNLQAVWDEESIRRGLIKYHDSSLQEYLTEIRSREEQVERYQTEIARQRKIIQQEDAAVEAKKEAHKARKETRGGRQAELDIELERISATAREERVQRCLKTLQEEQASLAKVQDEIKHLHSKIKNLADPEALAKGFHRETRKTSPDSVPEPAAVLAVAKQDMVVQRHKAIFEVVTNNNSKPLADYLATEPLGDRIKLSYTIAKSIPNNAHGPNVAAEMWAGYIQQLPSVDQQVAEATRAVMNYDSPDSLKKAAASVISSKFSQVSTQQQRLRSFETLVNRKQADAATIGVIAADLQNIAGSRGRMDTATQALTAISELPYTPELAATKRTILEQAHLQTDYLPNSRARFSFAAEILSFGAAPQETGITLNTEVVQHAKRLLTESFPFLGDALPKDFLPYESYFGDTKELKALIEKVKTAPAYNNDAGFQREFEQANTQREKVASLIDGVVKQTEGLESAPASQKAAESWATEVRSLGNPHAQLGALVKSEKMLEKIEDVDGKPELVKPWKQQIAMLYLEVAATLPDGVIKTNCYQYAFDEMQDPIAKEQLKELLIAIASDEHNHLKPEERIGLLQKVGAVDFEAGFDLRDPAIQRIQSMSAKYLDELIIHLSPEERVMALAGNLILTQPGSEEERNLGVRFRKELEQMPIQERRAAAYQVIQQYMMFRDHPLNRTVGDFGAVAAAHAKAVLNGEVYDSDAVMVVKSTSAVPIQTSPSKIPTAEEVRAAVVKAEVLGKGSSNTALSIDGHPDFVVRLPHQYVGGAERVGNTASPIDDPFNGRNFGQPVAEYGNGITVNRRQVGEPAGVPPYMRRDPANKPNNNALYERHVALAANMPDSAYVELLRDMQAVEAANKRIDPSKANNMLIDSEGKRFNIVDLNDGPRAGHIYRNSPGELVVMLFDNSYCHHYDGSNGEQLDINRRIILDKMLRAAETLGLPFESRPKINSSLAYSLTLAGYAEGSPERASIETRVLNTASPRQQPSPEQPQVKPTLTEHIAPPVVKTTIAPKAHTATRAGAGAGLGLGLKGLKDRLGDEGSYEKAKQVGGEQLATERQALAGDVASIATGAADIAPGIRGAIGVATKVGARVAPIVAAGAAYLEVQAANTAQDGRRGSAAVGGFAGGMSVGMATGATAGAIFGPWGAAIGGIIGGLGAGYVGSEIGRASQWGDQRQRDLDHKAQYALDQSVEVIAEIGRKRLRGEAWTEADKAAIRTIGGLMVEHINRMQVLEIPATDVDGRLRQQYQIQQTQHVIDYLNGKTERLPMASQQRDAHLIPSIDALLPELNDPKLGWKHWLHPGAGAVDRTDVLRTLSEYGVELHTLDKDGRKGVTIDELTTVLKVVKVDQRGKVTPARGAAHVERPPEIKDEAHENFRDGTFEKSGSAQKRFEAAMASWIPELERAGFGKTIGGPDGKITPEKLGEAMKRSGLRASEVDQDGNGNITEREAITALRAHGLHLPEQKGR